MSDEITRFDLDMDGSMDAFEDGRWVRYDDMEGRIAALEAERDAYKAEAKLLEHKVITCGVAASHSDANLAHTGAYAGKWDSPQAIQVRALRAERDALRKDRERYQWLANRVLCCDYGDNDAPGAQNGWRIVHDLLAHNGRQPAFMYGTSIDAAIDAAIAAKEPNRE